MFTSLFSVFSVKAVPYDSWNNYKILNFNDGFEGLQVNFNVTYGHGDNGLNFNCQEDFDDLRFFNYEDDVLLYAWNETTVIGEYIEIWLKLGASKNVIMRYNNPDAEPYWNIDAVFEDVIDGVVGAWCMNEPLETDEVVDYSGNGNDGTPTGTTVVEGRFGKARTFGASDKVTVNDADILDVTSAFTISAWVDLPAVEEQTALYPTLISKDDTGERTWFMCVTGAYQSCRIYVGGVAKSVTPITSIDNIGWCLVTLVYDGAYLKYYLNGVLDCVPLAVSGSVDITTAPVRFGTGLDSGSSRFQKGAVDEVLICNQAFAPANILNIYNYYGDPTLEAGKVCCRVWVDVMPSVVFGAEYSNLMNDALLIGVLALVIAMCALLLIIITKKK